jgi:hypothetical protein
VSGDQSLDELIGSSEHNRLTQIFFVGKNPLNLVDSLPQVGEVPRSHFELVELLDCRRICGTGKNFGEIVEHSGTRAPSLGLQLSVIEFLWLIPHTYGRLSSVP